MQRRVVKRFVSKLFVAALLLLGALGLPASVTAWNPAAYPASYYCCTDYTYNYYYQQPYGRMVLWLEPYKYNYGAVAYPSHRSSGNYYLQPSYYYPPAQWYYW